MKRSAVRVFGPAALAFAAAACSAGGGGPAPSATGGSAGATTGGSSNAGAGGTPSIQISSLTQTCPQSNLGRPLLRRLTAAELKTSLEAVFPQAKGQFAVTFSESKSPLGFYNDPAVLSAGGHVAEKLLATAEALAGALTADSVLPTLLPCAASADRACAQTFLTSVGRRLFRRPLTQAEQDSYLAFFDQQQPALGFKGALRWMAVGLIQSPHAFYRREIGVAQGGEYQLSQYEIASELSYTFTGTTPSEELLGKAERAELSTPDQLAAVASELMSSPAGVEQLHGFFSSWLAYTELPPSRPNAPDFAGVSTDMVQETRKFVEAVVLMGRGGYKELLTAPTSNPSAKLAAFYGFPAPASDYAAVTRPGGEGIGILAQGSVLASHSHEAASSPTLRGLLVFERLLCGTRPEVPPNVPTLVAASPGVKTTRQRYEEQHMAAGGPCPACHRNFDPLGFALEHYDEAGRYRTDEAGLPINSTGTANDGGVPVFDFTGEEDLSSNLAALDKVGVCTSGYLAAYAFANSVPCLGETRRPDFVAGRLGFADYLASLATEPTFTRRK